MTVKLYNTLSRKKESFRPIRKGRAGLYTCGPTVYNFAHIGNLRTFIFEDVLERTLEYDNYRVERVMNITDVGHLTSDADTGEDKVEREARKEKKSVSEITKFYTEAFRHDAEKLNIVLPKTLKPASRFIKEQQEIIKRLLAEKFAYEAGGAVYFDVAKFKNYGALSGQSLREKITAARKEVVADREKKNPADFVLWFKRAGKFKNHIQHWPSPWGDGFPGWHIECSAISRKFLGQPFDIHTGGVDHIGTHHTNEIAQSEAAYGKPLARYWLHGEFLLMSRSKMAKSESNFLTLSDLEKRGFHPLTFRYLCLQTHYRSKLNFSWEGLEAAQSALRKIYEAWHEISVRAGISQSAPNAPVAGFAKTTKTKFAAAINDDLNTPASLAVLHETIGSTKLSPGEKIRLLGDFDRVLGISIKQTSRIPEKIRELAVRREQYRASKQFVQADRLRKKIGELGYLIKDTSRGPVIWPKNLS